MEASASARRDFDHLREHSIGLPGVLFQSITHMAPAAAVAYSIYISVPHAGAALPLSVFLALVACLLAANSIGQLAKDMPSAGGLYVYYAMARNGIAPKQLARTHPRFKTPHVAILLNMAIALFLSFALGWKWGPLNGFIMLATAATVVVILVYMLVMAGSIRYYLTEKRDQFNWFLHLVCPIAGIVLFAFPLYYQYNPLPAYPIRYAVWVALGWVIAGLVGGAIMQRRNSAALKAAQRIYVADEVTGAAPEAPAVAPAS
jgi:amino acid transporter